MPTFRYRAYDSSGRTVAGVIEAMGPRDATQRLRKAGLFPASLDAEKAEGGGLFGKNRVDASSLALTTRQLGTLLASGSPLSEALGAVAENTTDPFLSSVLLQVKDSVSGGASLVKALEEHPKVFSGFYRGLVAAGEASGALDSVLLRLSDYLESRARFIQEARAALTYPILMIIVAVSVVFFLFLFVMPKITRIFADTGAALPFVTRMLIWMTNLVSSYWYVMVLFVLLLVWGAGRIIGLPKARRVRDRLLLKMPWVGPILTEFYISNFTRALGSLLKGGVPLLRALEITRGILDNSVFHSIIDDAVKDCAGGAALSTSLKKHGAVPPIVIHMMSVGERSGRLD